MALGWAGKQGKWELEGSCFETEDHFTTEAQRHGERPLPSSDQAFLKFRDQDWAAKRSALRARRRERISWSGKRVRFVPAALVVPSLALRDGAVVQTGWLGELTGLALIG